MRTLFIAVFMLFSVLGCRETHDRCAAGEASAAACCEADPSYAFCETLDSGTDTSQPDTGVEDEGSDTAETCTPTCGAGLVCDPTSLTCVGCLADVDCADGVCDPATDTCVGCLADAHCATGQCDEAQKVCVACLGDEDCTDGVCDLTTQTCAACLSNEDCGEGACKVGATSAQNACVACLDNSWCGEAGASRCEADACVGCQTGADCGHLGGDLKACADGVCVGCTSATEATDCKTGDEVFACDVSTNTCSGIGVGSGFGCQPCVSSSSCATGFACVPTEYQGAFAGNYCMPLATGSACPGPYGADGQVRMDVAGTEVTVCMINELISSCGAVNEFGADCTADETVCVADGGSCQLFNSSSGTKRCTYSCAIMEDCKLGVTCNTTATGDFCGSL